MTRIDLEAKTVAELREMCREMEIVGMSKKRKDIIIDAILKDISDEGNFVDLEPVNNPSIAHDDLFVNKPLTSLTGAFQSTVTNPSSKGNDRVTTVIRISCGASSGDFDVAGRSVGSVAVFLESILNIPKMSKGIVDGEEVDDSHVLQVGETLEFIKPAGDKGSK